jgi:hypothetical protein
MSAMFFFKIGKNVYKGTGNIQLKAIKNAGYKVLTNVSDAVKQKALAFNKIPKTIMAALRETAKAESPVTKFKPVRFGKFKGKIIDVPAAKFKAKLVGKGPNAKLVREEIIEVAGQKVDTKKISPAKLEKKLKEAGKIKTDKKKPVEKKKVEDKKKTTTKKTTNKKEVKKPTTTRGGSKKVYTIKDIAKMKNPPKNFSFQVAKGAPVTEAKTLKTGATTFAQARKNFIDNLELNKYPAKLRKEILDDFEKRHKKDFDKAAKKKPVEKKKTTTTKVTDKKEVKKPTTTRGGSGKQTQKKTVTTTTKKKEVKKPTTVRGGSKKVKQMTASQMLKQTKSTKLTPPPKSLTANQTDRLVNQVSSKTNVAKGTIRSFISRNAGRLSLASLPLVGMAAVVIGELMSPSKIAVSTLNGKKSGVPLGPNRPKTKVKQKDSKTKVTQPKSPLSKSKVTAPVKKSKTRPEALKKIKAAVQKATSGKKFNLIGGGTGTATQRLAEIDAEKKLEKRLKRRPTKAELRKYLKSN